MQRRDVLRVRHCKFLSLSKTSLPASSPSALHDSGDTEEEEEGEPEDGKEHYEILSSGHDMTITLCTTMLTCTESTQTQGS